jgi:hypothetical protein
MTLVEQFPDHTYKIREKLRMTAPNYAVIKAITPVMSESDKTLAKFYDDEFRRWHYKFIFILAGCFISLCTIIASAPGILEWMIN